MSRSERIAKYNRLIWIEKYLGKKAKYPQLQAFNIKI
jgi:enolase